MLWNGITIENYNNSSQYLGDFKLTPYLSSIFNDDINKCFTSLAVQTQEVIDQYLNYAIRKFTFDTLLPIQKELLLKAVFYQINHILYNVLPIERTEDQSVSIPNSTSINLALKAFIFSADALSTQTKTLCDATALRYNELNKEKYIESRITYLPNIGKTYTVFDLQNLDCNFYYFIPNINGIPQLNWLNYQVDNALSAFLQKINDYTFKLLVLYYQDPLQKIENITESYLYINPDKNPINIGDDGCKWLLNSSSSNKYYGDTKTIQISTDNLISAIGLRNNDEIISFETLQKNIADVAQNKTNIDTNKTNITTNQNKIRNNYLLIKNKVDLDKLQEQTISTDPKNAIILGTDKKLFSLGGGGGGNEYYADNKTTSLDSKNTFSVIGVLYKTKTGTYAYNGTDIATRCDAVPQLQASLVTILNLYKNKCVIKDELKKIIAPVSERYNKLEVRTTFLPDFPNLLWVDISKFIKNKTPNENTNLIKLDATGFLYVDGKEILGKQNYKPLTLNNEGQLVFLPWLLIDNTVVNNQLKLGKDGGLYVLPIDPKDLIDSQKDNQIILGQNKKLYVPQSSLPKWKLFAKTQDFKWIFLWFGWVFKTNDFNVGDTMYFKIKFIFNFNEINLSATLFLNSNNVSQDLIFQAGDNLFVKAVFNFNLKSAKEQFIKLNGAGINQDLDIKEIYVWKLSNNFEPIPPIPPTPHPTKEEQYNVFKEMFKTDGRY